MRKSKEQKQPKEKLGVENDALRGENLKLQRRIVTLEAKLVSAQNKIVALQERVPLDALTDKELEENISRRKSSDSA